MLEPEIKFLASTECEPAGPATPAEEARWWGAIVLVLAATLAFVWILGMVT